MLGAARKTEPPTITDIPAPDLETMVYAWS